MRQLALGLIPGGSIFGRRGYALDGSFQGLVQRGPGLLVFLLGNAALLMLHFQLKHLFLQRLEQQTGAA